MDAGHLLPGGAGVESAPRTHRRPGCGRAAQPHATAATARPVCVRRPGAAVSHVASGAGADGRADRGYGAVSRGHPAKAWEPLTPALRRHSRGRGAKEEDAMEVYVDGQFVPADEARISVFDHGFLYGDG